VDPSQKCGSGELVDCGDYRCSHSIALMAVSWVDDVRLSDLEPRFVCPACGKRGAEVRPDFSWRNTGTGKMGYC
jgi:hypothetical protein